VHQVFVALISIFIIPDLPRTTSWLTEEEKALAAWRQTEDIGEEDWVDSEQQSMFYGAKLAFKYVQQARSKDHLLTIHPGTTKCGCFSERSMVVLPQVP
jgi:hypothetical protein